MMHYHSKFRFPTVVIKHWPFSYTNVSGKFPAWWPVHAFEPIIERDPHEGWNMLFWFSLYTWVALGRILKLGKKKDGSS